MVIGTEFHSEEFDLNWRPWQESSALLPSSVVKALAARSGVSVEVCEVSADHVGGKEFADLARIPLDAASNSIAVEALRGSSRKVAVVVIPGGTRCDLNGSVRRALGARSVRLLSPEDLIGTLDMEVGSVGPIGVPGDVHILVDESLMELKLLYAGSGLRRSKVRFSPQTLNDVSDGLISGSFTQPRYEE